jgi:hypothetical protein
MSLISAIYDAIFTETPSDVTINERSFVSVLLDSNNKESLSKEDFRIHSYKGKSLILTRHLVHFVVTYVVLGIIWLIYFFYNFMHWCATGRWRGTKSSSGINFIIGSTVLIATIIILIYILAFLIKDVVLSPNNARINNKGVITVDQPCLETHSFFLLNAATFWTSTDIQISKDDEIFITASGSIYSDVGNMYKAAVTNDTLLYQRNIFAPNVNINKDATVKYCIYGRYRDDTLHKKDKEYPRYGSLLYQICTNHKGPVAFNDSHKTNAVRQMNFSNKDNEFHFTADKSGVLYLTFNDILLDTVMFDRIVFDNGYMKGELDSIGFTKNDCINNSRIWFQDNLGEVLVNVRIEKNIWKSDLPFYKKVVVAAYRKINYLSIQSSVAWIIVLISIMLWFIIDGLIISNKYKKRSVYTNNKYSIKK